MFWLGLDTGVAAHAFGLASVSSVWCNYSGLLAVRLNLIMLSVARMHTMCLGCWRSYGFMRPVLKHGPRSLTCVRVFGWQTPTRRETEYCPSPGKKGRTAGRATRVLPVAEQEHPCWDPKDGELCLCRVKSLETVMEARSDTDVQIVRLT